MLKTWSLERLEAVWEEVVRCTVTVSLRLSFNRKQSTPGCRARFYGDRSEDPEETKNPSRNIMKSRCNLDLREFCREFDRHVLTRASIRPVYFPSSSTRLKAPNRADEASVPPSRPYDLRRVSHSPAVNRVSACDGSRSGHSVHGPAVLPFFTPLVVDDNAPCHTLAV